MKDNIVKPPSRKQLITLRSMIIIGLVCMAFFIDSLLDDAVIGYKPLYYLLLFTFLFTFFKITYEWYHYWSIRVVETPPGTRIYTVDVFTTFCAGEPYEMIENTLTAMQAITYPHQSFLCDEADDPYLKSLCRRIGVHHVTRLEKKDAKAGNINNALKLSNSELCVILDPDHIPVPGFLDPIVSHFDNPQIGFVQVVQAYYNQESSWIAKGAAQQTYQFYGPIMMCMNTYGTVQAIGANCTFRRTALDSIGGHASGLAEDMHTAMQLHAKKWKSVYVPQVLSRGLVPATLSAYYKQQLKWSRGVFELLTTSYFKLFLKFSWRQKLHYGLLPFFYLSGFVFGINFLIPIIALFTEVLPMQMDFSEFLIISIPFISSVVLIRHYVQQWVMEDGERGFHIIGGLLLIGSWWVFVVGTIYTVIRKKVPYIATPKEIKDEKNLLINLPNIVILGVTLWAIIHGLYQDWNPFSLFMAGIAGLNCAFMIFMLIISSELKIQRSLAQWHRVAGLTAGIKSFKGFFWLFRRKIYSGVRRTSLILTILIVCISIYTSKYGPEDPIKVVPQNDTKLSEIPPLAVDSTYRQKIRLAPSYFHTAKGVTYSKGSSWYKNLYPLTKKIIIQDFTEMRVAGFNSIKIFGPNIYDHSIIEIAATKGMDIYYSFSIPAPADFLRNSKYLEEVATDIADEVAEFKSYKNIKSWNLGGNSFQQLAAAYRGVQFNQAKINYIHWLKKVVALIKKSDGQRPITIDVVPTTTLPETVAYLHREIPELNAFGLVIKDEAALRNVNNSLDAPYFISSIHPRLSAAARFPIEGIFYANWQDQQSASSVTLDGLKDIWGHNKPSLLQVIQISKGKNPKLQVPHIKILKPAITAFEGTQLTYRALLFKDDQWLLASGSNDNIRLEWYLVQTDEWGNTVALSAIGNGPAITLVVPQNPDRHRIYLIAIKGNNSSEDYSTLNTPLLN